MFKNNTAARTKYLTTLLPIILVGISLLFIFFYFKLNTSGYLSFSDGAKFANIAGNLSRGSGFSTNFSFWGANPFSTGGIPYLVPFTMSFFFKVFGAVDFAVIAFSSFFYLALVLAVFLLGKKLYGNLVGTFSALAVASNISYLNYASSGASETMFAFLAVLSSYFLLAKKWFTNILFFLSLVVLYLTRPQAVVFILALLFCWFMYNFSWKKGLALFSILFVGIFLLDRMVLYPLSFKYPVYPIVTRGIQAIFQYSPTTAVSDALRGQSSDVVSPIEVAKKVFYNLYNFYKLLPEIISPYLFGFFALGLFIWGKDKQKNIFKLLTILVVVGSILLAALTIPFFRYLHPVVPFIYIVAAGTLVEIIDLGFKNYDLKSLKSAFLNLTSIFLILVFAVGQTLGVIFLDSRFVRNTHNVGQPPVYAKLSYVLRDNTNESQTVVTNLDTWGSWYGERKTVWFPLEPKMLIDKNLPVGRQVPFDAIYLTSYLIDDENYYMGPDWRQILDNPTDPKKWVCDGCAQIAKEFKLKGVYEVASDQDYERQGAKGVLLVKD